MEVGNRNMQILTLCHEALNLLSDTSLPSSYQIADK